MGGNGHGSPVFIYTHHPVLIQSSKKKVVRCSKIQKIGPFQDHYTQSSKAGRLQERVERETIGPWLAALH